jgi:hypothetical protein
LTTERLRRRRTGPRRREVVVRVVVVVLLLVVAFVLGMAVARTLDERPEPGGVVTTVRTLTALPQGSPPRTVTVTVTSP